MRTARQDKSYTVYSLYIVANAPVIVPDNEVATCIYSGIAACSDCPIKHLYVYVIIRLGQWW